jgi:AraC-like DNA-binding protein
MAALFHRYISVSNNDRQWGLFVTSVGHSLCSHGQTYPPAEHPAKYRFDSSNSSRVLDEFALVLIAAGKGTLRTRFTGSRPISQGDVILLPPGMLHQYHPDADEGWEEYWVTFGGSEPSRWLSADLLSKHIPIASQNMHLALVQRFAELLCAARKPAYSMRMLASLASVILSEAIGGPTGRVRKGDRALRQAADAIRKHPDQFDLHIYAEAAELGKSTFRRKFKEEFGVSPAHFAQQRRVERAKQWLAQTALPLHDIASRLEFSSEFYFMRFFKRMTGQTPTEWRRYSNSIADASSLVRGNRPRQ